METILVFWDKKDISLVGTMLDGKLHLHHNLLFEASFKLSFIKKNWLRVLNYD